jgi:hypothetical protein
VQRLINSNNNNASGFDFAKTAIQPKLKVSQPGDVYEQEADRIADKVIAAAPYVVNRGAPPRIQRFTGQSIGQEDMLPSAIIDRALTSLGTPLEPTLRHDMEQRFEYDFSRVRVHSGTDAERSARALGARAYTVGNDIVFGSGQFAPTTEHGRRLLAHELTHVVQQSQVGIKAVQQKGELSGLPPIVLGLLTGMDKQGETILGTYLYGGGKRHDIDDPIWSTYMMEHHSLRSHILSRLIPVVRELADRGQKGRYPIVQTFHAEFPENSGFSGYALLHGTDRTVGDFRFTGWATVEDAIDPAEGDLDIELDLRFAFNDIINPNRNYIMDRIRSAGAEILTLGQAESYELSIYWSSSCLAEVKGQRIELSGYPSERRRGIRPLPRAKLDWVRAEKERAQKIEAEIVTELQRRIGADDVAAQAGRKRRLLWAFYHLSGYWGQTYLDRISNPSLNDPLPRLLRDRISSELRAELIDALHGRRPPGDEPL